MDITKQVVEQLKASNPHIELFFDSHFELISEETLIPKFVENKIEFPTKHLLRPKKLTIKEKIAYYLKDLELFLGEINESNKSE